MPIYANNFYVGNNEIESNGHMIDFNSNTMIIEPVSDDKKSIAEPLATIVPLENISMVPRTHYDKEHGLLVVDGKEKKISKQSQYILDMLTLDNE